jgi:hypothetical protein
VVGAAQPQDAVFYLRGRRIGKDMNPPIRIRLGNPPAGSRLEAVATSIDGRIASLRRKLSRC